MATPEKADSRNRPGSGKTFPGWTFSTLIAGLVICLVSVAVSGMVAFLVADHTSWGPRQDTARQVVSSQQTKGILRLQKSADAIGRDAQNVAVYAFECSAKGKKWAKCMAGAPGYLKLLADADALGVTVHSTTDQPAGSLAVRLAGKATALTSSRTMLAGVKDLRSVTNTQLDLDQRCGQVIQGYA